MLLRHVTLPIGLQGHYLVPMTRLERALNSLGKRCLSIRLHGHYYLAEAEGNAPSSLISKTSALLLSYAPTILAEMKGFEPS